VERIAAAARIVPGALTRLTLGDLSVDLDRGSRDERRRAKGRCLVTFMRTTIAGLRLAAHAKPLLPWPYCMPPCAPPSAPAGTPANSTARGGTCCTCARRAAAPRDRSGSGTCSNADTNDTVKTKQQARRTLRSYSIGICLARLRRLQLGCGDHATMGFGVRVRVGVKARGLLTDKAESAERTWAPSSRWAGTVSATPPGLASRAAAQPGRRA